jgi:ABC-type bacteriocin/lantibiotic exporter with double-glycine peptidase domain
LIVGLLTPTGGTIEIDQTELNAQNKLAWRKSIAYVTQENFLLNTSIRHNLQIFGKIKPDKVLWDALRSAAAEDFVTCLKDGLDTVIGDGKLSLSGGERQRIVLARALLTNPQLLVLDECTSSLDKQNIIIIQQALTKLRGKMTIIIVSHQLEMQQLADKKIILGSEALPTSSRNFKQSLETVS